MRTIPIQMSKQEEKNKLLSAILNAVERGYASGQIPISSSKTSHIYSKMLMQEAKKQRKIARESWSTFNQMPLAK